MATLQESKSHIELMKLDRKAVIAIFRDLQPPSVGEMDGEYRATLLDQGRWTHNFFTSAAFQLPGSWLSKSFSPISATEGRGFNTFRSGKRLRKIYRMRTYLADSHLDGKPSYHLDYLKIEHQDHLPVFTKLSGQVRLLGDGLYLGLGTADFGFSKIRREQPFLLEGPIAEYDESVWANVNAAKLSA